MVGSDVAMSRARASEVFKLFERRVAGLLAGQRSRAPDAMLSDPKERPTMAPALVVSDVAHRYEEIFVNHRRSH